MKMMFQTFISCTGELVNILKDYTRIEDPVEMKEVFSRFATDIIGSCAFGLDCNSLKNPNSEFRQFGKKIFESSSKLKNRFRDVLVLALPNRISEALGIKQVDEEVEEFFMRVVKNTVSYREKNRINRNDFMQLLLHLKNDGKVDDEIDENLKENGRKAQPDQKMTINELASQCFLFFIAGYETSATTMTFALLELALNQDIQENLRNEIDTVLNKYDGNICYEAVMEMSYLDKVINGKI